jgi:hypothetical protein
VSDTSTDWTPGTYSRTSASFQPWKADPLVVLALKPVGRGASTVIVSGTLARGGIIREVSSS